MATFLILWFCAFTIFCACTNRMEVYLEVIIGALLIFIGAWLVIEFLPIAIMLIALIALIRHEEDTK